MSHTHRGVTHTEESTNTQRSPQTHRGVHNERALVMRTSLRETGERETERAGERERESGREREREEGGGKGGGEKRE